MRITSRALSSLVLGALALAAAGAILGARSGAPVTGGRPTWKQVEQLVSEQKFEEASKKTAEIREAARKRGDDQEVTGALIREVQLRIGLHGYETAVRFLKDEAWPKSRLSRAALNLFYGRSLVTYAQAYGWEIGQREKVESKGGVDLKAWTKEQIHAEAARAYLEVWKDREALGAEPLKSLAEYLDPNNYPQAIRGTLRDAATYLFVELLADTSGWRPEQSNELFGLDVAALAKGDPALARAVKLDDPAVHPLVRIGALLDDLEAWHTGRGEREAALEARLQRLQRLHDSFTESADRRILRREMSRRLSAYRDVPWWAEGQAVLAGFVEADDRPGNLVRARALALEGARVYPGSIGGQRCLSSAASIERPDYQIASMSSDGTGRRSIEVTHRNLPALHFRAYALDLVKRVESVRNYNLLPAGNELEGLLEGAPAATWETALPATPDYKSHRTFVTPPVMVPGLYAVVASARADFGSGNNRLRAATIIVTGLVLVTRQTEDGGLEVRALSGTSGKPVLRAAIDLYRYDWQKGHRKTATATSGPDGLVRFSPGGHEAQTHFVIGHSGADLALDANYVYFSHRNDPSDTTASLVFTDRSVYRPMQKILWKVVAFQGNGEKARYHTLAESSVTVSLVDPNGQMVDSAEAKTNGYGSAAGEFTVPTGRLLGGWQVRSSMNGAAYVRVEEYKRPTFEATFKDPKDPLRLNKPATLRGEARYYFGLPVVNGTVKWRVTREPVYPWWWGWWWRPASSAPQTVATGSTALKEDGGFSLAFTPKADERKSKGKDARGITYRFRVSADVTDEGGETRQASRGFRLGFVSVEARMEKSTNFFLEGNTANTARASIVRTDLDGAPRAGKGTWRLVRLVMPEKTLLPAEFPSKKNQISGSSGSDDETEADGTGAGDSEIQTPGDRLRPRWSTGYTADEWMREWKDGAEAASGTVTHDAKGEAKLALPALAAGAYRLRYSTVDDFGATYEMAQELVVAGKKSRLPLPALLLAESTSVRVGGTARLTILSGLPNQTLFLDIARAGKLTERRILSSDRDATLVEIPIGEADRGGFGATLSLLRDHQFIQVSQSVFVPWDDRELKVEFATFRDAMKPGVKETWRVTVKGATPEHPLAEAAEVLAYMYDRSLDIFAPHNPQSVMGLYPNRSGAVTVRASLGSAQGQRINSWDFDSPPGWPSLIGDRLKFYDGYGIGGPGRRLGGGGGKNHEVMRSMAAAPMSKAMTRSDMAQNGALDALEAREEGTLKKESDKDASLLSLQEKQGITDGKATASSEAPVPLRSNFSETAFFKPQLLTDAKGSATIEFTVPDSVTSWNVWVHAVTRDLRGGSLKKETKTVKELMVRPYLPRFLREGDKADIKVVVNNASERELSGKLTFDILDPATNQSLLSTFGLTGDAAQPRPFTVKAAGGTNLTFSVTAPKDVRTVAFKVTAVSGDTSDGELRPLPVLPGRIHLVQSRFVTLKNKDRKILRFLDLEKGGDPTLINEQMVVTVDAQLFYTVLQALPYLVNYPYECTEQTLNRFVSTGIVSSVYKDFPAIARMAAEMAKRTTPLESWDAADPNRKMTLEESPWLINARGGQDAGSGVTNVLDPRIAKANRDSALAKIRKAQTSNGGFPWWPGGPPSPYMTLYILHGFAKAQEFGVDVPKDVVQRAWQYVAEEYRSNWRACMARDGCWEFLTFLNYIATCYPDASWMNGALTDADQKEILNFSFKHWKEHAPYLKGYLSLTLERRSRMADARLVWASVMDSAKSNEEQGTFWAPEDRSWLWYNDTIETHAFALRTLMELDPSNPKKDGLVQWLLLNKKLNQWKSTRATAEVIYSLVHYLKKEGALGVPEDATVTIGSQKVTFTFEPDSYTGNKNQIVVPGEKIDPKTTSTIVVEKESKGFAFASAAWHFSTEKLPGDDRGDFFAVSRKYFRRENTGREFVLRPLGEGAVLKPGDEIEIQISLRTKHEAEYVHLRDPRAAGLEPENAVSRYKWDLGISWYEETRDSATNFFFERLPVGEYTFKYRLRANMAGTFRVGPATVQSMYAPEFNAYSAGAILVVAGD